MNYLQFLLNADTFLSARRKQGEKVKLTRIAPVMLSLFFIASCEEVPKFPLKVGENYNLTSSNVSQCVNEAKKFYPEDVRTYSGGGYSTPIRTSCTSGYGGNVSCSSYGGDYIAPYNYDMDVNFSKRLSTYHSCLEKKGYDLKVIKECKGDKVEIYNEIMKADQTKQGTFTPDTCSITVGGEFMIRW